MKSRFLDPIMKVAIWRSPLQIKRVCLRDAILASCAAPTFFAPKSIDNLLLADGCLWANNPSAIAAAQKPSPVFGKEAREIRMLIHRHRTFNKQCIGRDVAGDLSPGWGGAKLTSYVMTLQAQASAHTAKLLLKGNYLRINPEIDRWEIDNLTQLEDLKSLADARF